jgi:hypothetical protein
MATILPVRLTQFQQQSFLFPFLSPSRKRGKGMFISSIGSNKIDEANYEEHDTLLACQT